MAQMGSQILPARLTTDDGVKELARRPVGTGAYRFVEWVKDERLVMEANRDWWGWEGKTPGVERAVWKPIPDDFPRIVALEKGDADIITNVPPDRIKGIADGGARGSSACPRRASSTLSINSTQPPARRQARAPGPALRARHPRDHPEPLRGQGKPYSGGRRRHRLRLQPGAQAVSLRPRQGQAAPRRGRLPRRDRRDPLRRQRHHGQRQGAAWRRIADMWARWGSAPGSR